MAKSTKHQDKIGTYDTFRAPWETESGAEVDVDKPTLKRLLFNLKSGEAKALDARDDALETVKTAETERDEAKEQAANANPAEAQKRIEKLEKENGDLRAEKEAREAADAHEELRKEVIGDLDPKYAKYVQGEDKEALEKSLEAVKADFGLKDEPGDDEEEDEDHAPARTTPVPRLKSGGDRQSGAGSDVVDFEAAADQILGRGPFG